MSTKQTSDRINSEWCFFSTLVTSHQYSDQNQKAISIGLLDSLRECLYQSHSNLSKNKGGKDVRNNHPDGKLRLPNGLFEKLQLNKLGIIPYLDYPWKMVTVPYFVPYLSMMEPATMLAMRLRMEATEPSSLGWTRFVRNITKVSVSGSIQIEVPVYPVCP